VSHDGNPFTPTDLKRDVGEGRRLQRCSLVINVGEMIDNY
jgi:hypothetical protein